MRNLLLATLALSPMLLHAQANSPAQPQATTLQSKLVQPDDFATDRGASTAPVRISTGIVAPKLVHSTSIASTDEWNSRRAPFDKKVVVEMLVDENGVPSNLKVVNSLGTEMDKNVLAAVSQYRFKPGTLDQKPATVPLTLEILLHPVD
ncbi:MAG TPA: energy transducer TonB [Edaphobacter sp.]|nr:energy transducer TonB [Edaphobacter sp.]